MKIQFQLQLVPWCRRPQAASVASRGSQTCDCPPKLAIVVARLQVHLFQLDGRLLPSRDPSRLLSDPVSGELQNRLKSPAVYSSRSFATLNSPKPPSSSTGERPPSSHNLLLSFRGVDDVEPEKGVSLVEALSLLLERRRGILKCRVCPVRLKRAPKELVRLSGSLLIFASSPCKK
mmetsp:Transcript_25976/g.82457  ORF Transcript_25976/g.82457 Transcript_25976/m.82457 type:complete len:176 (+) Transcript_25976:83-610(+)